MEENKTAGKLKNLLDSEKMRKIIIIAGVVGIALIFLSNYIDLGSISNSKERRSFP